MKTILIIEDDNDINNMLKEFLELNDFNCDQAFSGTEGLLLFKQNDYDLVLLDLMLPGKTGEEVIKEINDVPVLVLSAMDSIESKVTLLEMGASDYLAKPFDLQELLARIHVLLRGRSKISAPHILKFKDWELDQESHTFKINDVDIDLTNYEFQIIALMMSSPNRVFSKQQIYEHVWNEPYYADDKSINVHISNIRMKLKPTNTDHYLETVWGLGFRLIKL